jgi:hypothetical protein
MAKAFPHLPVPKFSAQQLALAEVCAIEIWNGLDYSTGKECDVSDEDLLVMFATPTFAMSKSTSTRQNLQEIDIRTLIRVAQLKALFRSAQPTDFQSAIFHYRSTALPIYLGWKLNTLQLPNVYDYATQAILDWSPTFVNNTQPSLNGNYRVPLACRILFFAMPDMCIFNFSNGLRRKLAMQSRSQAAIPHFNKSLYAGLLLNQSLLANLDMPKPTTLDIEIWTAAYQNGWWQRRVLDLALLLHFGVMVPQPSLRTKAQKLAASWASRTVP